MSDFNFQHSLIDFSDYPFKDITDHLSVLSREKETAFNLFELTEIIDNALLSGHELDLNLRFKKNKLIKIDHEIWSSINIYEKLKSYKKKHCYQFEKRVQLSNYDLGIFGLNVEDAGKLTTNDFNFSCLNIKEDEYDRTLVSDFIRRYEWLGKLAQRNTHAFGAFYKNMLAGVVVFSTPNSFHNLLGPHSGIELEKLISRGACASFTPKNLASKLLSFSINWMSKNTSFRIFSAYSDPEAFEIGTIYQAMGAIYLGPKFGGSNQYFDPSQPEKGWFSDREARKLSAYKRFALQENIVWLPDWHDKKGKILWDKIPAKDAQALKDKSKAYIQSCQSRRLKNKHKYVFIRGSDNRETKNLIQKFKECNPHLNHHRPDGVFIGMSYPKKRGE